jgi:hypothetical protein
MRAELESVRNGSASLIRAELGFTRNEWLRMLAPHSSAASLPHGTRSYADGSASLFLVR